MKIMSDGTMQTIRDNDGNLISQVFIDRDGNDWFISLERVDCYDDMYGDAQRFMDLSTYWYTSRKEAFKAFDRICWEEVKAYCVEWIK